MIPHVFIEGGGFACTHKYLQELPCFLNNLIIININNQPQTNLTKQPL